MTRRTFLSISATASAATGGIRRELFRPSPAKGIAVMAYAYYTRPRGGAMMSIEQQWSRSDTVDAAYYRYSGDYGRTWSEPVEHRISERRKGGTWRRAPRGGWTDPSGVFLEFWNEGVLPTDNPLEGLKQWSIWYGVSGDGGRSHRLVRQVIHKGREFDSTHPFPGVYTGKNGYMIGENTCRPFYLAGGSFLLPVNIFPLAPDGSLYNPTGAYTYSETAILHACWNGSELEWEMRARIRGNPDLATRGMDEPTLAMLQNGRMIVVIRGSNDRKPELPSRRWVAFSDDQGWTWTTPAPWTYTTGEPFFSPSSCSQLVEHSGGSLFWLGNITPENPRGNRPRYPFVIGQVDRSTGLLMRASVRIVDDRGPGEDPILTLSNFFAHENRRGGDIDVHMTRLCAFPDAWSGDAFLYHIPVG